MMDDVVMVRAQIEESTVAVLEAETTSAPLGAIHWDAKCHDRVPTPLSKAICHKSHWRPITRQPRVHLDGENSSILHSIVYGRLGRLSEEAA